MPPAARQPSKPLGLRWKEPPQPSLKELLVPRRRFGTNGGSPKAPSSPPGEATNPLQSISCAASEQHASRSTQDGGQLFSNAINQVVHKPPAALLAPASQDTPKNSTTAQRDHAFALSPRGRLLDIVACTEAQEEQAATFAPHVYLSSSISPRVATLNSTFENKLRTKVPVRAGQRHDKKARRALLKEAMTSSADEAASASDDAMSTLHGAMKKLSKHASPNATALGAGAGGTVGGLSSSNGGTAGAQSLGGSGQEAQKHDQATAGVQSAPHIPKGPKPSVAAPRLRGGNERRALQIQHEQASKMARTGSPRSTSPSRRPATAPSNGQAATSRPSTFVAGPPTGTLYRGIPVKTMLEKERLRAAEKRQKLQARALIAAQRRDAKDREKLADQMEQEARYNERMGKLNSFLEETGSSKVKMSGKLVAMMNARQFRRKYSPRGQEHKGR